MSVLRISCCASRWVAAMKLYVHYEDGPGDDTALTLKLTLPKKWVVQPISQVLELFLESYNKKKPSNPLDVTQVHFAKASGETIRPNEIVQECTSSCEDLYVKRGALAPAPEKENHKATVKEEEASAVAGQLRCRNYGCNKHFTEDANSDTACKFHTAPPVFHDTKKGWSCCPKRVYDWDEFNLIEGCTVGRHSTVDPKEVFAASPTVSAAASAETRQQQPVLKSIEDYNLKNPNAASAVDAAKTADSKPLASTVRPDGTAKCLNKGCQKVFKVAENHEGACTFHSAGPVFHDAAKFWACCPNKVKYDFDAFLQALPSLMTEYKAQGNVQFLGVARFQDRAIVASHAYNTVIDLNGVKEVLKSDQLSVRPGVHFSFSSGGSAWHLMSDAEGRIFILISERTYPVRAAHACLEEFQRQFIAKTGTKSLEVKEKGLDKAAGDLLRKLCEKYDNLLEVDKLAAVISKVESVKLVLQENVQVALANCVTLENIEKAAEDLQAQAGMFKKNATTLKKQMWWKQFRMKLVLGIAVLAVLLCIIIPLAIWGKRIADANKKH